MLLGAFLILAAGLLLVVGMVLGPLRSRLSGLLGSVPIELSLVLGDQKARQINQTMRLLPPAQIGCLAGGGLLGLWGLYRVFQPGIPLWFRVGMLVLLAVEVVFGLAAARVAQTYEPDMNQMMQMASKRGMMGELGAGVGLPKPGGPKSNGPGTNAGRRPGANAPGSSKPTPGAGNNAPKRRPRAKL